ncbi:MAG TPA: HAMP domain-containing sensor histidine kinase [Gemmatimonadales bacterium]|nr:HAMP domain-containing sensor histidine kinase [Gemmatimonadales bacterium]
MQRRSLRTELLVSLGFVTSAAVILVGLTTVLLNGGDVRVTLWPLVSLWIGSTAVFVLFGAYLVHRSVVRPLGVLAAEADRLAVGALPSPPPVYETAELDQLSARYRAMAEDLLDAQSHIVRVEKLAGIGQLAAGVAHEVRNPLGAIATYLEVLQRRGADPGVTAEIRRAIDRIERIVQGLLDYGRQPGAAAPVAGAATDLNAAVRTVADFLEAQGMFRDHEVDVELDEGAPLVCGVRHALEQVVVNLVVNACQAGPATRITVGTLLTRFESRGDEPRATDEGDEDAPRPARRWAPRPRRPELAAGRPGVMLFVADNGPGVPEASRERIFDPFFTTKEPGQGTGLGLAIVARTVHESGGVVWVDRAREGGAVFKVFLPLAGGSDASADR